MTNMLKSLGTKLKSIGHYIKGKAISAIHLMKIHKNNPSEKHFSDISQNQLVTELPKGYNYLNAIRVVSNIYNVKVMGLETIKHFQKVFPTLDGLVPPDKIKEFREDFKKDSNGKQDFSEIIFIYGEELVYLYDYKNSYWFARDTTYKPMKEYFIGDSKAAFKSIAGAFDTEKDEILRNRINVLENKDTVDWMYKYCNFMKKQLLKYADRL